MDNHKSSSWLVIIFLIVRLILISALSLEGLRGYSDLFHYYRLASLGLPYIGYWVEHPPLFPFLSTLIYHIAAGKEDVYYYLLIIIFTLAQCVTLAVFISLSQRLYPEKDARWREFLFGAVLIGLAYGWWYYDSLAVMFMFLGLYWMIADKDYRAGWTLALGALTKWFPVLVLVAVWRYRQFRQAILVSTITLGVTLAVYTSLFIISPDNTAAAFISQSKKGSWETIWALLDGNIKTGNLGTGIDPLNPTSVGEIKGNPSIISPWITLLIFGLLGLIVWMRTRNKTPLAMISLLGVAWCLFFVWSPGYSPQWLLYLLPLIILVLPEKRAWLIGLILVFVNLLEWPVLLSRGLFQGLWYIIPFRTGLIILTGWAFWRNLLRCETNGIKV